jgi:hypothetical protein
LILNNPVKRTEIVSKDSVIIFDESISIFLLKMESNYTKVSLCDLIKSVTKWAMSFPIK